MTATHPNSERRTHPRIPVDLPGEIRITGHDPLPCRIRDLCRGGLRLECPGTGYDPARRPDASALLRFELPHGSGRDWVQARVQVVHGVGGAFGARFLQLGKASAALLIGYLQAHGPAAADPAAGGDAQTARMILQRVTSHCLEDLMQPLLDGMQEVLWTFSERAGSDAERSTLIGDIILLESAARQQRLQGQVRQTLLDPILQSGDGDQQGRTTREPVPSDLELVDPEGFDLWLAVSALAERLERQLGDSLRPLRALSTAVFDAGVPLSVEPQGVARALRQALVAIGMGVHGQLLCLRAAGRQLPRYLETCYRELAEAWEQAGLTPRPAPSPAVPSPAPPERQPGPPPTPSPQPTGSPPAPARDTPPGAAHPGPVSPHSVLSARELSEWSRDLDVCYREALGAWEQAGPLESPHAPAGDAIPRAAQPGPALSAQDLSELLLAAASAPTATTSGETLGTRLQALLPVDATGAPRVLPPALNERVEVTDRLLTRMLEDPLLAPRAKDLIQRLSPRFLAVAVSEPGFFTTPTAHPLVDLIDQIEHLSMFLSLGTAQQKTPTQRVLERLIQQILATDPRNLRVLRDLSRRLAGLQQRLGGELQRSAERVVAGHEGRGRVREARRQVRARLNEAFAGRPMHPVVADLVRRAWRTLLQLTWVREGADGTDWRRYWQALLDLHQACIGADQAITLAKTTALLEAVREGLGFIGFDPYQRALLDEQVEAALQAARSGPLPTAGQLVFEALPPDPDEIREEPAPAGLDAQEWARALAQVDGLRVGAALQLRAGDTELGLRLVWRSGDGGELVFIDPGSLRSKAVGRGMLAQAFQQGDARAQAPVERTLTGRAMDATLREMQERIHYHETHDALTGLSNRRQLLSSLTQVLTAEPDDFTDQVLGFLELGRFDALTSTCGYLAGERLLVAVSQLLQNLLEQATCLAYLSGNRFAFLLPVPDAAAAEQIGQRICDGLATMPFYWDGATYPMPGSIGLMLVTAASDNPEALLSAADTACRAAQRNDAGQVVLFREGNVDIARYQERMRSWTQAEAVVKAERLRLRGQRIAATTAPAETPHHYEVLLSVYDEQGAPLPLDAFIGAAEAFNLMAEMDRLVLGKALDWVHAHPAQARALGGVAINLSGQSLGDRGLIGLVRDSLRRLAILPELISFEVTETAAITNLDQAAAIIEGIKALGCRFALDDFGSGMSSYSYLKRLPVDYLKIDGSFVKEILRSPQDHAIVKSINEVAHFMGKQTIAEYVESPEILQRLCEIGVDYVQGYAVEKPCFLDEIGDERG